MIKYEELSSIICLYNNYVALKNNIEKKKNHVIPEEYYLIRMDWIEEFKKIFHYDDIIQTLTSNMKNLEQIDEIPKIDNSIKIQRDDIKKLKIIQNTDMIIPVKEKESYYYSSFCLILPKYYNEIIKRYIIDEKIKYNILIKNGMFIFEPSKNTIEVGIFDSPYSYSVLCAIVFNSNKEKNIDGEINCKKGIEEILSKGFIGYLNKFNITDDMFFEYKGIGIQRDEFDLIIVHLSENKRNIPIKNNNEKITISSEILDISNRKGFVNFNQESSKLNSIIQVLTSIIEIWRYFTKEEVITQNFKKFNNIYILTSFFLEVINEINSKNNNKSISLEQMDIIINYLSPDIAKKDLSEYLHFILQTLYNELLQFPQNLNHENLISFESPLKYRDESYNKFNDYYNKNNVYKKCIISELFNWIMEKKVVCNDNFYSSSFQAFPFIIFDIDLLFKKEIENRQLIFDLNNCFQNYSIVDNNDLNQPCIYCHNYHSSKHFISTTPPYFIIVLNRKNESKVRIIYQNDLDVSNFAENPKYKKYKLIGVIMQEGNNYYSVIKKKKGDPHDNYEEWKKFQNDIVSDIIIDRTKTLNEEIKNISCEVYNEVNSRILFYKGINS